MSFPLQWRGWRLWQHIARRRQYAPEELHKPRRSRPSAWFTSSKWKKQQCEPRVGITAILGKLQPLRYCSFGIPFFLPQLLKFLIILHLFGLSPGWPTSFVTQILVPQHQCKPQLSPLQWSHRLSQWPWLAQPGHLHPFVRRLTKEILTAPSSWSLHHLSASGRKQTSHTLIAWSVHPTVWWFGCSLPPKPRATR